MNTLYKEEISKALTIQESNLTELPIILSACLYLLYKGCV